MTKRMVLAIVLVFCFAYPVAAGPSKEESAALKKCIEAHTNLSKVSREAALVLLEARKGGKVNVKQYQGLTKAVKKWSDAVPDRCKDMDDLLLELKKSGFSKDAIMKCYNDFETEEDACIKIAEKQMKKAKKTPKKQLAVLNKLNDCVLRGKKPMISCINKNAKGNKKTISAFNKKMERIKSRNLQCWGDCRDKADFSKDDWFDACEKKCEKKSDKEEVAAIRGMIKELQ